MKSPRVFIDASVLIAAVLGKTGASRVLFELAKKHYLEIILTSEIIQEAKQSLARKYGQDEVQALCRILNDRKQAVRPALSNTDLDKFDSLIADPADRHVLAGAQKYRAEYLVTLDRKHFFTRKLFHARLNFQIMLPGDFLREFRQNISK
ncbi:MAG: putative toxin-antitoxin system toxin component, PIN family [bacterium]